MLRLTRIQIILLVFLFGVPFLHRRAQGAGSGQDPASEKAAPAVSQPEGQGRRSDEIPPGTGTQPSGSGTGGSAAEPPARRGERPAPGGWPLPQVQTPQAPVEAVAAGSGLQDPRGWFAVPELPDLEDPLPYRARREAVMKVIPAAPAVLFGIRNRDTSSLDMNPAKGPRLEKNFYYLTGLAEQQAGLVLAPYRKAGREILLLEGAVLKRLQEAGDRRLKGFEQVLPLEELERVLGEVLGELPGEKVVHGIVPELKIETAQTKVLQRLLGAQGRLEYERFAAALTAGREIKGEAEVRLIERACAITANGFLQALRGMGEGVSEKELGRQVEDRFASSGGTGLAFPVIAGGGVNSAVIHYMALKDRFRLGELALLDIGAEVHGYASDITRTFPTGGRFSEEQLGLYNLVYTAQLAGLAAVRPGKNLLEVHKAASDELKQWVRLMGHGVSHHVGLYVHDIFNPAGRLKPGMVITVEPGVYLRERKMGVRIEDTVLVTETGYRLLSHHIPKDPKALEEFFATVRQGAP